MDQVMRKAMASKQHFFLFEKKYNPRSLHQVMPKTIASNVYEYYLEHANSKKRRDHDTEQRRFQNPSTHPTLTITHGFTAPSNSISL
jgi:hypothetical protein